MRQEVPSAIEAKGVYSDGQEILLKRFVSVSEKYIQLQETFIFVHTCTFSIAELRSLFGFTRNFLRIALRRNQAKEEQ